MLLRNEKSDSVTRSVVTSLDPSVGSADSSRSVYAALLDGLRPSLPAVSLRRTSQMLCALPSASPTLLDGFTVTSRRLYLLFPLALPALLDGLSPSLLAGFTGTSQMLCALPSASPTLLGGLGPPLLDGLRPSLPAASFRRSSQMFIAFSPAPPAHPYSNHTLRLIITLNKHLSLSSMNSISGQRRNALSIPLPRPLYGRILVANDASIGFRMFEFPDLMFSIVKLLGRCPGLIISILSGKIKIFT